MVVCDLVLENGKIMEITVKKDVIRGKVLLTADNEIELEGYGRLTLSDDFRIYKIYGGAHTACTLSASSP